MIIQKNLAKHPTHPEIPSPRKLPIYPIIYTPQPIRPRITNNKAPIPIKAKIVIPISKDCHVHFCGF